MSDTSAHTVQSQAELDDATKTRSLRRDRELRDLSTVMRTREGRRLMWRLLESGRIFAPCFTKNSETFFNEGKRELMLEFFNDIMICAPDEFRLMQEEHLKADRDAFTKSEKPSSHKGE